MPPLLILTLPLFSAEPIQTVWILGRSPAGATSAVDRIRPDVHSVNVEGDTVVVRSAGISLAYLGPLESPPQPKEQIREFVFRFPSRPEPETGRHAHIGTEFVGAFLNGVPIYNQFEAASYRGQNLWHYDLIARGDNGSLVSAGRPRMELTHAGSPGLIEKLIPNSGRHSPIIGFALDGFPIYGPWGATATGELRRMRSSYQLRRITLRDHWPDGTRLAPGQYGPPVDSDYPLGTFVEDYEYVSGSGDLDQYNGRFAKSPEHPKGTYAYFLTTDPQGRLTFPYMLAQEYFGRFPTASAEPVLREVTVPSARIQFRAPAKLVAGQPVLLHFNVLDQRQRPVRYLEYVHERPVHLMVVSQDLVSFDHIHPEVNEHNEWLVRHTFSHGGRYRLYADVTPPGSNQQVQHFDVTVEGPPPPLHQAAPRAAIPVNLEGAKGVRAGEDVELVFKLAATTGLQPYLGAWAHVAIAAQGLRGFVHAHPLMDGESPLRESEAHTHSAQALGPPPDKIRIATSFPSAGLYRLWLQLQVAGKVETIPFTMQVAPPVPRSKLTALPIPSSAIRIEITPNGFEPARIEIPAGKAVTLAFQRSGEPNCGAKLLFPDLGLTRDLPLGATTLIDIPPQPAAELRFTCGMGMYRGGIVVRK